VPRKKTPEHDRAEKSTPASERFSASRLPALARFLGGYLHQDWQDEHVSPADAAQQFCDEASKEERESAAREWEVFRSETKNLSLPVISSLLSDHLGAAWNPKTTEALDEISAVFRGFTDEI
jgi:hypothetical protein